MKSIAAVFLVLTSALAHADPIGLGIYISNGTYSKGLDSSVPSQLHVLDDGRDRYLSEFDVASKVPTTEAQGIAPLKVAGPFGQLDWTGVHQIPCHPDGTLDDWRLEIDDVHYMHSTCYGNASWMTGFAILGVDALDSNGHVLHTGRPLLGVAGEASNFVTLDSWWERRFTARVVTHGCSSVGDCSAGTSYAEALVQARGNLHPDQLSGPLPACATSLRAWIWQDDQEIALATIPLYHDQPSTSYGYGLRASLARVTPYPAAGYFSPGDAVSFQVTYTDAAGNRFFPASSLPSYGAASLYDSPAAAGMRYLTYVDDPVLYWAHKNTQSDMAFTIAGPIDQMNSIGTTPITIAEAGLSQIPEATPAVDGYTALIQIFPPTSSVFPCLFSGGTSPACLTPNTDTFTMTIPTDAKPGTWTAQVKARRVWEGEPNQAASSVRFQVGQAAATSYTPKMGGCSTCHFGRSSLAVVGHGFAVSDHEIPECLSCHTRGYSAWFENDAGFDDRMRFIHLLSRRFFSMGGTAADVSFP